MAQNAFRASRVEMMQSGIPIDYVDALLDDKYMADLIEQTNRRIHKRNDKLRKYFLMQKLILGFLLVQALVGCWVALYKTVLQPDVIWGSDGTLQNVDMVLMMDASKHMDSTAEVQHSAVMRFTGTLKKDMQKYKKEKQDEQRRLVEEKQANEGKKGFSQYFPILRYLKPSMPRRHPKFKGGKLQFATGLFNAESTTLLHNLTENEEEYCGLPRRYTAVGSADSGGIDHRPPEACRAPTRHERTSHSHCACRRHAPGRASKVW
mmetsp:Transcript_30850/g.71657  ORF Transcript_30850/g.71657 Transcript_30850/m.71657 type:complete len:263 (+) Transcript_30850:136-924(+)